jgi:DNA-binding NarL/FixJ family response regulator
VLVILAALKMIKKTVTIIDSDVNFCVAISSIIDESNKFIVNQTYQGIEGVLKKMMRGRTDIIIMDVDFAEQLAVNFILQVREKAHWIKILVLTNNEDLHIAFQAINNGASGYLYKKNCIRGLGEALDTLSNGGAPIDPFVTSHVIHSIQINRSSPLSNRETMILKYMIMGKTSTGIASDLILSRHTVRTHVKNIFKKLNVNSREQALRKAVDDQLIVGHLGLVFSE